jgi:hypothetical protein
MISVVDQLSLQVAAFQNQSGHVAGHFEHFNVRRGGLPL